jgi:thymidine phosphorylase
MDAPLGLAVGNAVEVQEAVAMLSGGGPPDLAEVTLALAAEMLALAGLPAGSADAAAPGSAGADAGDLAAAGAADGPVAALADGRALDRYRAMIRAQGGDPDAPLPQAVHAQVVTAAEDGWLRRLDARAVGVAAWRLGAGRARKEDPVSAAAGVICLAKPGDRVERGQPLLELRGDAESRFAGARDALAAAIEIGPRPPDIGPLILERIQSPGAAGS